MYPFMDLAKMLGKSVSEIVKIAKRKVKDALIWMTYKIVIMLKVMLKKVN